MGRYYDAYIAQEQKRAAQSNSVTQPRVTSVPQNNPTAVPAQPYKREKGWKNIGIDATKNIANAVNNVVPQLPSMAGDLVKMTAKGFTPLGFAQGIPAFARGFATGVADFVPSIIGGAYNLGVDAVNSYNGEQVANHIPREYTHPMASAIEQWKELQDMSDNLSVPVVQGQNPADLGIKPANGIAKYISGNMDTSDWGDMYNMAGQFAVPMGVIGKAGKTMEAAQQANKISKLTPQIAKDMHARIDVKPYSHKAEKIYNSIDKEAKRRATEQVINGTAPVSAGRRMAGNLASYGALGALEGETPEERLTNAISNVAMGVMGHGLHAGGKKIYNTEPVKAVRGKIANDFKDATDTWDWVSRATSNIDTILNTDLSKNANDLTKFRTLYNRLRFRNPDIARNITPEMLAKMAEAKEMTPEEFDELFEASKLGMRERAQGLVNKQKNIVKNEGGTEEQIANVLDNVIQAKKEEINVKKNIKKEKNNRVATEDLTGVKSETDINTHEDTKTHENEGHAYTSDEALQQLRDAGLIDEIVDPVTGKKKVALRLDEQADGVKYTGAESTEGYKKTYEEPGRSDEGESDKFYRRNGYTKLENPSNGFTPEENARNEQIMNDWQRRKKEKESSNYASDQEIREQMYEEFGGKNEALQNAEFYTEDGKRVDAVEPKSGKLKNEYEIVRANVNGENKHIVRHRSPESLEEQNANRKATYKRQQEEDIQNDWKDYIKAETDEEKYEGFERNEESLENESGYESEEGVNSSYTKPGFQIEEGEKTKEAGRKKEETAKDIKLNDIYNSIINKLNDAKSQKERDRIIRDGLKSIESEKDRQDIRNRISEYYLKKSESSRARRVGETSEEYNKAKQEENDVLESLKDTYEKGKTEYSDDTIQKSDKLLEQIYMNKFASNKGFNFDVMRDIMSLSKNGNKSKNIARALTSMDAENAQKVYDSIYESIAKSKEFDDVRIRSIREINKELRNYNSGIKTKDSYEATKKSKVRRAISELKDAVETEDVDKIIKIFRENNHKLHKDYNLTEQELDVIRDAYALEAKSVIDEIKRLDETVRDKYQQKLEKYNDALARGIKPKYKPKRMSMYRTERQKLREKANSMKGIIKNFLTDYDSKERYEFDRDGKLKATGDTWQHDSSDVGDYNRQLNKVLSELDNALDSPMSDLLDKFWRKGEKGYYKEASESDKKALSNAEQELQRLKNYYNEKKQYIYDSPAKKAEFAKLGLDKKIKEQETLVNNLRKKVVNNEEYVPEKEGGYDDVKVGEYLDRLENDNFDITMRQVYNYTYDKSGKWYDRVNKAIEKTKNGERLTIAEKRDYTEAKDIVRDAEKSILEEERGGSIKYRNNKSARQGWKIGEAIANGEEDANSFSQIGNNVREVLEGYTDTVTEKGNKKPTIGDAVGFIKLAERIGKAKHTGYDVLSSEIKDAIDAIVKSGDVDIKNGMLTIFRARDLFRALPVSEETADILNRLYSNVKDDTMILTEKLSETRNGATTKDGVMSFIHGEGGQRKPLNVIKTTIHEAVHRFLRQNKNNTELLKEFGLTEQDLKNNDKATAERKKWWSNEGKPLYDFTVEFNKKNGRRPTEEEVIKAGYEKLLKDKDKLNEKWLKDKEETVCDDIANKVIKEILDDRQRTDKTNGISVEQGRDGDISKTPEFNDGRRPGERQGNSESSSINNTTLEEPPAVKKFTELLNKHQDVAKAFGELTDAEIEEIKDYNNKKFKQNQELVDELDRDFLSKSYDDLKKISSEKVDSVHEFLNSVSKHVEDVLLKYGRYTKERLKGRLYKQSETGEGMYFLQGSERKDRIILKDDNTSSKYVKNGEGLKKRGTAEEVVGMNLQRMAKIDHADACISFLKKHFSEKKEGYVPVNSGLLFAGMIEGKSSAWLKEVSSGEKAIRDTFKPDEAQEWLELYKTTGEGKADLYLPKDMLENTLIGEKEFALDYLNTYGKRGIQGRIKGMAKMTGALIDFYNDRFKRMVLTSGSFLTNNIIGNQLMVFANAASPADYVRSIADAFRIKDTEVPTELLESTLAKSVMQEAQCGRKYFTEGNGKLNTITRLIDGDLIDIKANDLHGGKRALAHLANWGIARPNGVFRAISRFVGSANDKIERFSRKQAYAITLRKMGKNNILKMAASMKGVEALAEAAKENPMLRQTVIDKVENILGDYNNFTKMERSVFKRIVPFYAWDRTITRHIVHLVKDNPVMAFMVMYQTARMLNQDDGLVDWQHGSLKTGMYNKRTKSNVVFNKARYIPWATLFELFDNENNIGSVSTLFTKPAEAIRGKKFFRDSEITSKKYKHMTVNSKEGYFNTETKKFEEGGLPVTTRVGYLAKDIGEKVFPMYSSPLTKMSLKDKQYDADLGGYNNGDYIGKVKTKKGYKKKYRSAQNALDMKYKIANRFVGGIQPEHKVNSKEQKDKYQRQRKRMNH